MNTNPNALIGSNGSDNNTWGTGSTSGATGPDIGSTWRGAVVIRASYVIDAEEEDGLDSLNDLMQETTNVVLTLNVTGRGAATSGDYQPRVYFRGVINQANPTAGYWGAWDNATVGANAANVVAGVFNDSDSSTSTTVGDSFTFAFASGLSGLVNRSDFIAFGVVGNQDTVANESLNFGTGTLEVHTPGGVISVSFTLGFNDNNNVQSDEVAGIIRMKGEHWNNILCRVGGGGQPDRMVNRSFLLKDSTGALPAATLVSTLDSNDGYCNTANVLSSGTTGDRGMMMSHLAYDINNTDGQIEITGLGGDYTWNGYDLYIYFERNSWRIFKYTVTPSGGSPLVVVGQDGENGNQFVFDGTWVEA